MNHNVRELIGDRVEWCDGRAEFRFTDPANLYTVALGYVKEFSADWSDSELESLHSYTKFGEFEPFFGPKCDLCVAEDSQNVYFLIFEELGHQGFAQFGNSSIDRFVACIDRLGAVFHGKVQPARDSLLRALVDIVSIDAAISETGYWWNLIKYFLEPDGMESDESG